MKLTTFQEKYGQIGGVRTIHSFVPMFETDEDNEKLLSEINETTEDDQLDYDYAMDDFESATIEKYEVDYQSKSGYKFKFFDTLHDAIAFIDKLNEKDLDEY